MDMKSIFKDPYVTFIFFVIIIKFMFVFLFLLDKLLQHSKIKSEKMNKLIKNTLKYETFFKLLFDILMSLLLIYLFNPRNGNSSKYLVDFETRILFFIFGWLMLVEFLRDLFMK